MEPWLALSSLLEDGDFLATLRAQHEPFSGASQAESAGLGASLTPILSDAVRALEDGCKADSEPVRALVERWTFTAATQLLIDGLRAMQPQ